MNYPTGSMHNLLRYLTQHTFRLDLNGVHGLPHWFRVRERGLVLAEQTGADPEVVEAFAYLHDAMRFDDGEDPDHGARGATLARHLRNHDMLRLADYQMDDLATAISFHSRGLTKHHRVNVMTCWDADRLDLGRVGIRPDPARLCTMAGRAMLARMEAEHA